MKLKKIASLMLAGVMAVSMLTACGEGKNETKPEGEGNGEGTTASGYSAMLGNAVADILKDSKHDDVVTFADNNDDQIALEDALGNIGATDIRSAASKATLQTLNNVAAKADFKDAAKLNRDSLLNSTDYFFDGKENVNNTRKAGEIYYIDGSVEMSKVIDAIANKTETAFKNLQESATVGSTSGTTAEYKFNYTVSVSVVNVPATSDANFVGSVNFIAVTVTRTVA